MNNSKGIVGLNQMMPVILVLVLAVVIEGLGATVNQRLFNMPGTVTGGDNISRNILGNGSQGFLDASTLLPVTGIVVISLIIIGLVFLFKS